MAAETLFDTRYRTFTEYYTLKVIAVQERQWYPPWHFTSSTVQYVIGIGGQLRTESGAVAQWTDRFLGA
jgi:hypothetical protein